MSPIGRVFIILNLILAGTFVGFAGTYLQKADDFRLKFQDLEKQHKEDVARLEGQVSSEKQEKNDAKRQVDVLDSTKRKLADDLAEARTKNEALEQRLSALEGTIKALTAHAESMDDSIKRATEDAKSAMDRAIAAEKAKDEANAARDKALDSLAKANFDIKNRDSSIADQSGQIARLEQGNRENQVIIDLFKAKAPGVLETLQPLVTGKVEVVSNTGKHVTIALESGKENLKGGHRFAIFNASEGYLGEATVTDIDPKLNYAFATMTLNAKEGRKIRVGDSASTNLNRSGKGVN